MVTGKPPTPDPVPAGPPVPKPAKKTGRPSDAERQARELEELKAKKAEWRRQAGAYVDTIQPLVEWPFDTLAERRGSFWKLSPKESGQLSLCLGVIFAKWLPYWLVKWEEEIALGIILGTAFLTRVKEDRRRSAERRSRSDGAAAVGQDNARQADSDAAA